MSYEVKGLWGLLVNIIWSLVFLVRSGVRGGGKCPEEEHTTCSGGPTINCHKRGLRGERKLFSKKENNL
jgi:hypothetical protein